jgi:surface protein
MAQIPIPFSSSFRSLTLNVTTGTAPNQVTHTQAITSVFQGNNSVPITDAGILNAFNSQAVGTSFTSSIVAEFGNALTTVSTPSVASFIPRVISLADIPNKLTTDASFNLSSLITTVSDGVLSYSSSVTSVATVNSSGQVTPVGAGTTTITVSQAATANHPAGTASATLTVSLPPPPISLASNNVTIQYTGAAGDVPTSSARFIEANPRGTGMEWFAVVKDGMKDTITNYANGLSGSSTPFTPPGQSQPVPFNNIVTTLMTDMSYMFINNNTFNQYISSWDTSNVTNMFQMFANSSVFNQPLNSWNTSAVTNMAYMFYNTAVFNRDISGWDVTQVTQYELFRTGSALINDNTPLRFVNAGQ